MTELDPKEAAGRMYHDNIRPMINWLDKEWEQLPKDLKAICVDDAMDIVNAWKLASTVKPRPMIEAPPDTELRVYGPDLPIAGKSFIRTMRGDGAYDQIEIWTRVTSEHRMVSALPPDWGWLYLREVVR